MFANPKLSPFFRPFCRFSRALVPGLLVLSAAWAWADPVKIEFVPPPIEGTISLGIYDSAGKLVRVLHREAENSDFSLGEDGLRTQWDGNDDHGAPCPAGTYRARGAMVGDLGVEGLDFVGNDWVGDDDSPHLNKITDLSVDGTGALVLAATLPGDPAAKYYSVALKPSETPGEEADVQLTAQPGFSKTPASPDICRIENQAVIYKGKTVKSGTGDPAPTKCAASPVEDKLYELYENAQLQRVRAYDFAGVGPGAAPKVLFENDILFSPSYEQVAPQLKFPDGRPFAPAPILTVSLVANPLSASPDAPGKKNRKPATLQLRAQVDKEGAWIVTGDGLPLCKISDTPNLRWAAMGRPAANRPVTFFDSDGAAVEEFQVPRIGNVMLFDAGALEWTPAAPSPTPGATPAPSAAPSPAEAAPLPPATLSGSVK